MRKRKRELRSEGTVSKRGNNVRLSVTTYFQILRNGGGEEVKPDVIGRSKNTRVPPIVAAYPSRWGRLYRRWLGPQIYLSVAGRRIDDGVDGQGEERRVHCSWAQTVSVADGFDRVADIASSHRRRKRKEKTYGWQFLKTIGALSTLYIWKDRESTSIQPTPSN